MKQDNQVLEIKPPQELVNQTNIPLMQNELFIGLLFLFGILVIGGSLIGKK